MSHDTRLSARCDLEESMKSYYHECCRVGYDFADDILDIMYDSSSGLINLTRKGKVISKNEIKVNIEQLNLFKE
jgi:hypothetical protein